MLCLFINNAALRKDPTIQYLSGYAPEFCILAHDVKTGKQCMFVAAFECGMYSGIPHFPFNKETFTSQLKKFFNRKTFKVIGINKEALSMRSFATLKKYFPVRYEDVSALFSRKRMIKQLYERRRIAQACLITDQLFTEVIKKTFATERDIANYLLKRMIDIGVEPSFHPVVATARNARKPHHIPGNTLLSKFTVLDFGVKYKGYCSDMTRMLYYGTPSQDEISAYNKLRDSFTTAVSALSVGKKFAEVDALVRKALGKAFTHALGHGVGVEVHEQPSIAPASKHSLKDGMVFTIEPGVYSKYGMRLEDTFICSNEKVQALTKSSHDLVVHKKRRN